MFLWMAAPVLKLLTSEAVSDHENTARTQDAL